MPAIPGFVGQAYTSVATNVAAQTLFNWYPETVEAKGEASSVVFYPTPGTISGWSMPDAPVRAVFEQDGRAFAVANQTFCELNADLSVTTRGTLSARDTNPATIVSNGMAGGQLFVVSGGHADIFNLTTNTLTPVTAAGYPTNTSMGVYLDSYFGTFKGSSAQVNISKTLDGTQWSALDFAVRTDQSDNIVAMIQNNRYFWLIGSQSSEPWYDSGATFPFQAVPQNVIPMGTCAPFSVAKITTLAGAGVVVWLHQSPRGRGIMVSAEANWPKRISTFAVEAEWASYPTITDAVTFGMTYNGHDFAVVTFPQGNATWVYDFTVQSWFRWTFWNTSTANHDRHRGWLHCFAFGKHCLADWQEPMVWVADGTVTTDNGSNIVRERQSPHTNSSLKTMFFGNFQVDLETGLGNSNPPGDTPTMNLSWSNDGGLTFGTPVVLDAGVQGAYGTRCRAAGSLGSARNRVWRLRASDPVPYRGIQQVYVDVVEGTS